MNEYVETRAETIQQGGVSLGNAKIIAAAEYLFDNRLGEARAYSPHAPREFWADLGEALYGANNATVKALRDEELSKKLLASEATPTTEVEQLRTCISAKLTSEQLTACYMMYLWAYAKARSGGVIEVSTDSREPEDIAQLQAATLATIHVTTKYPMMSYDHLVKAALREGWDW